MAKSSKKKKGKSKKQRDAEKQKILEMGPEKLIKKGRDLLEKENAREAVSFFKQAEKNGAREDIVRPALSEAYLVRFEQLIKKGMHAEASSVMENCLDVLPDIWDLPLDTAGKIIKNAPLETSVSLYQKLNHKEKTDPETDRLLANRVVLNRKLELFDSFSESAPLARDRALVEKALSRMSTGDWEGAAASLSPVGRKSPYSDIKLFAKLMKAFVEKDDAGAVRACSMLSKDFPLQAVPEAVKSYVENGEAPLPANCRETGKVLFGAAAWKDTRAAELTQAVSSKAPQRIIKAVKPLVPVLAPGGWNWEAAERDLMQLAEHGVLGDDGDPEPALTLMEESKYGLGPQGWTAYKVLCIKGGFLNRFLFDYLDWLHLEFPDPFHQKLAQAEILLKIAAKLADMPGLIDSEFEILDDIMEYFETEQAFDLDEYMPRDAANLAIAQIAEKVISLDTENREAYNRLLDLPLDIPAVRKKIEPQVSKMVRSFPDDPVPCLRLAEMYYWKNAFRKAEDVLKTAWERAPHDIRVKSRYALSFLVAGTRNLARKKLNLVAEDFEKAGRFGVESLDVYVAEKKMMLDLVQTGLFSRKTFDGLTRGFGVEGRLRSLLLLQMEMNDPIWDGLFTLRGMQSLFNELAKEMKTLSSEAIRRVLQMIPKTYQLLYKDVFPASGLVDEKPRVLSLPSNEDLAGLVIDFTEGGYADKMLYELEKRRKKWKKDFPKELEFCHVSLKHIHYTNYLNPEEFLDLINSVDEKEEEKFRFISRKLAPYVREGHLREAFELYDFSILQPRFPMPPGSFPFPGGLPDFDLDDMDEFIGKMMDLAGRSDDEGGLDDFGFYDEDEEDEDEDFSLVELQGFDVEKAFGKIKDPDIIMDMVYDLAEVANLMIDCDLSEEQVWVPDLRGELENIVNELEKKRNLSTEEIRKAGKRFGSEISRVGLGTQILEAFSMPVPKGTDTSIKVQYFIMGMKSAV